MISIFITLFSLTVYSLISSNEIVRNAELIQYILIADFVFLLILLLYLSIFLINYLKYKNREVVGLRLFNKFFLFFGLFSIIPSGIILLASAIFFNIEVSTWLGPAFKSTVNNSYQLAQKYINQTERDLITDSKFIRNYVLAERLIDRDIISRIISGSKKPNKLNADNGTLILFYGRNYLHRVTPVESEIPRILITLNYNEENNVELSENARMTFFGRL